MNDIPVIIDLDTGCDDAIELIMATLNHINLKAFTCTAGNTSLKNVIRNTTNILGYIGSDIKAYAGCHKPIQREFYSDDFHGANGLGGIEFDEYEVTETQNAVDYIYQTACQEGKIVLLCSGPLTNIATLFIQYPDVVSHIEQIIFMGGSLKHGNATPYAEFNVYADPEAYDVVFKSGVSIRMIGLDVTMVPSFFQDSLDKCKEIDSKESKVCQLILSYLLTKVEDEPDGKAHLHDVIALFALLHPECFEFKECHIEIQCGNEKRGQTKVIEGRPANCEVAVKIEEDKLFNWFYSSLKGENK